MRWVVVMIILPFVGTAIGAGGVFFIRKTREGLQKALSAFAAGVMTAACVWSLIMPSVEQSAQLGRLAFLPCLCGIFCGAVFTALLDRRAHKLKSSFSSLSGGVSDKLFMTFLAVTVHNFPEGLAVGMMCASALSGDESALAAALAFSLAISLQNIPEGAIISLPMHNGGATRYKSFLFGALSGAVEPLGACLTLILTSQVTAALPFLFGFAAGAMLFVTADGLIEKRKSEGEIPLPAIFFCLGFSLMMSFDVALG